MAVNGGDPACSCKFRRIWCRGDNGDNQIFTKPTNGGVERADAGAGDDYVSWDRAPARLTRKEQDLVKFITRARTSSLPASAAEGTVGWKGNRHTHLDNISLIYTNLHAANDAISGGGSSINSWDDLKVDVTIFHKLAIGDIYFDRRGKKETTTTPWGSDKIRLMIKSFAIWSRLRNTYAAEGWEISSMGVVSRVQGSLDSP